MHAFRSQPLLSRDLAGWRMAGAGGFDVVAEGTVQTRGGPGLLWYAQEIYENFVLKTEWRVTHREDNSGVFVRCPPLLDDIGPAVERGYEVQIDERGYDPERGVEDSPLHLTGAIYGLVPARVRASRPLGEWNELEIRASGGTIEVTLNGTAVSGMADASRELRGHVALQAHHEGSRVQFRALSVRQVAAESSNGGRP